MNNADLPMTLSCQLHVVRGDFTLTTHCEISGGMTGIFGPSGSGKSTLLHAIAGLLKPQSGRIAVGNHVVYDSDKKVNVATQQRRIGLVFQEGLLFPHMSGEANLRFGVDFIPVDKRRVPFAQVVDLLRLQPLLDRRPQSLSGGERQRLALGRALLAEPQLLLLDEPLNAVDRVHRADILSGLTTIRELLQIPMLYVSHDLGEIMRLTDNIIVLDQGKIIGQGAFADLVKNEPTASILVDPLVQAHLKTH